VAPRGAEAEHRFVFGRREAGEAVETNPEGAFRVVLTDEPRIREIEAEAELIFISRVSEAVGAEEGDEGFFLVRHDEPGGNRGQQESQHRKGRRRAVLSNFERRLTAG
jgi:hypothetical protein